MKALVGRVLFEGRRAVGVEYQHNGATLQARGKQIILSGGAINSPQLLMLSGIGPAAQLRQHGIAVIHDAPDVGEQLQDHFYVRTFWRCTQPITVNDDMASWWGQARIGLQYLLQRRGPLTVSAGYAAAFTRTRPEVSRPDAQYYFINFSIAKRGGVLDDFSGFTCSMSQLRAQSRGWVRLRSADPLQAPAIQYNYLATEDDQRTMVNGLKKLRQLVNTAPFSHFVAQERSPGPQVQSDADWLEFCRATGDTVYHPTSTCRMGLDANAVVDEQLRVRGVTGLLVIDASIMPAVISGNTNAAVVAIAEKAAQMLLEHSESAGGE